MRPSSQPTPIRFQPRSSPDGAQRRWLWQERVEDRVLAGEYRTERRILHSRLTRSQPISSRRFTVRPVRPGSPGCNRRPRASRGRRAGSGRCRGRLTPRRSRRCRCRVFYTIDEARRLVQVDHVARLPSPWYIKPLPAVTFCNWHRREGLKTRIRDRVPGRGCCLPDPLRAGTSPGLSFYK